MTKEIWKLFVELVFEFKRTNGKNQTKLEVFKNEHRSTFREFENQPINFSNLETIGFFPLYTVDNKIFYTFSVFATRGLLHFDNTDWAVYQLLDNDTITTSQPPQYLKNMGQVLKYTGIVRLLTTDFN